LSITKVGDVDFSSFRNCRLHSPLNLAPLHRQNQGGVQIRRSRSGNKSANFLILRTRDNHQLIESIADAGFNK